MESRYFTISFEAFSLIANTVGSKAFGFNSVGSLPFLISDSTVATVGFFSRNHGLIECFVVPELLQQARIK